MERRKLHYTCNTFSVPGVCEFKKAHAGISLLVKCPPTQHQRPKPWFPHLNSTPIVISTGIQDPVSESYRPQWTTGPTPQETLVSRISMQPRPKSPFNTGSEQHKETRAQGSISPGNYFRFHIRVTGGLG